MDKKITLFYSPFKPTQNKGRKNSLHLLDSVQAAMNRMENEGHNVKLDKCDEHCFIIQLYLEEKNMAVLI